MTKTGELLPAQIRIGKTIPCPQILAKELKRYFHGIQECLPVYYGAIEVSRRKGFVLDK